MSWEQVSKGSVLDIKKTKGKPYEGTYVGKQTITTKIGPQIIYNFESEDGAFGVYGFTNLNLAMENVKEGAILRVTYTGTENVKTKFGMKDVHQVKVEQWKGDVNKSNDVPPPSDSDMPF